MHRVRSASPLLLLLVVCAGIAAVGVPRLVPEPAPAQPVAVEPVTRVRVEAPRMPITPMVGPLAPRRTARTAAQRQRARLRRLQDDIRWHASTSLGSTSAGRLVDGVRLPAEGPSFFTLDPVRWTVPNRPARRWGTDRLVRTVLRVADAYRKAHPGAARMAVGDLSLEGGGPFDARHGIVGEFGPGRGTLGHVSHQKGLDVDIYYPRRDGREHGPRSLGQIDRVLAQELVDRFVAAGAQLVLVGPRTRLTGPPGVVQSAARHDDHIHVRLPAGA